MYQHESFLEFSYNCFWSSLGLWQNKESSHPLILQAHHDRRRKTADPHLASFSLFFLAQPFVTKKPHKSGFHIWRRWWIACRLSNDDPCRCRLLKILLGYTFLLRHPATANRYFLWGNALSCRFIWGSDGSNTYSWCRLVQNSPRNLANV